jgi:outer membrane protein OmpU
VTRDLRAEETTETQERIMKKVLLTTTALVMTAGVAAAEVSFSGTAGIAFVDDNGAQAAGATTTTSLAAAEAAALRAENAAEDALAAATAALDAGTGTQAAVDAATTAEAAAEDAHDTATDNNANSANRNAAVAAARAGANGMRAVSYYDMDVTVSAAADNGMTFAFGFDMGAGEKVDYDDDDKIEVQGVDVGDANVSATYMGWTLTVDQGGIDNLFDDTQADEDVKVSGSVAGFDVAFTSDLEDDSSSYSLGTTLSGVALTFTGTDDDDAGGSATGVSAKYTVSDALSLSASMSNESNDAEDDTSIGLTYKMDALTVGYTSIKPGKSGDLGDEWDLSLGYAAGAMSASIAVDEADATTMIAEWDLGGATAFAAMHDKAGTDNDLTAFGVNFSF